MVVSRLLFNFAWFITRLKQAYECVQGGGDAYQFLVTGAIPPFIDKIQQNCVWELLKIFTETNKSFIGFVCRLSKEYHNRGESTAEILFD